MIDQTHGDGPNAVAGATAAIHSLLRISPRHFGRYIQLVAASVSKEVMHQVRQQLPRQDRQTLSEWERRSSTFSLGLEEGIEKGIEKGKEEGSGSLFFTSVKLEGLHLTQGIFRFLKEPMIATVCCSGSRPW